MEQKKIKKEKRRDLHKSIVFVIKIKSKQKKKVDKKKDTN